MSKKVDLSILEEAARKAKYPSEERRAEPEVTKLEKLVPGGKVYGKRIIVEDASRTRLWVSNPRNFDYDKDISDLLPLVRATGGNSAAVDGRISEDNVIEIIAGSRRRKCCITDNLPLVVDLWEDVSDEVAEFIAVTENDGRKNITAIGMCKYLAQRVDQLKQENPMFSMDEFAESHSIKKSMMYERIGIGKLPNSVTELAQTEVEWSINQLIELKSHYKALVEKTGLAVERFVEIASSGTGPKSVLRNLKKAVESTSPSPSSKTVEEFNVGNAKVTFEHSRSGAAAFKISKEAPPELKNKILELIKNYS